MTKSEYSEIKKQIVIGASGEKHSKLLNTLKTGFKDEINSPRRFEQISTFGKLMEILELRDVINEEHVGLLRNIARSIKNEKLFKRIEEFEERQKRTSKERSNLYIQPKLEEPQCTNIHTNYMSSHPNSISKHKRAMIEEVITEEIGSHWRDLGRNLKVREGKIDEINATNTTVKSKVKKVLEIYDHAVDKPKWFLNLCDGLEQARRKDLSRSIQEIMTRNI